MLISASKADDAADFPAGEGLELVAGPGIGDVDQARRLLRKCFCQTGICLLATKGTLGFS